jgi:hypothetical protein
MENMLWGAPRIRGELLKLGFAVAQSTVAKLSLSETHARTYWWCSPPQYWYGQGLTDGLDSAGDRRVLLQ